MTNENKIMARETNNLANYFSQNAINMAVALHFENYEECEKLKKEKNRQIMTFLTIMNLFTEVNEFEAVKEMDATYEAVLDKAKSEIDNILKNGLHLPK